MVEVGLTVVPWGTTKFRKQEFAKCTTIFCDHYRLTACVTLPHEGFTEPCRNARGVIGQIEDGPDGNSKNVPPSRSTSATRWLPTARSSPTMSCCAPSAT
eukprot:4751150-Prymnesium_polylepis.3